MIDVDDALAGYLDDFERTPAGRKRLLQELTALSDDEYLTGDDLEPIFHAGVTCCYHKMLDRRDVVQQLMVPLAYAALRPAFARKITNYIAETVLVSAAYGCVTGSSALDRLTFGALGMLLTKLSKTPANIAYARRTADELYAALVPQEDSDWDLLAPIRPCTTQAAKKGAHDAAARSAPAYTS